MKYRLGLAALALSLGSGGAFANDVEGTIESLDPAGKTLVVQGITFHVNETTDFDDGLKGFESLSVGQKIEVDFNYMEGKHYAREIELDD
ncbi:DUF5666 domain-containing protein [Pseudomaricurvus sp.]|uniref:DUF5666 domain-containing protein n=1 Tax=Pseudomaricurvus sp. TaxID=2004510 RepID=UPI003F6B75EB